MCMLWLLLQLAVIFMYWDLPHQERGKARNSMNQHITDAEHKKGLTEEEEEDNEDDEEKPLMRSQELMGSYGTVVTSEPPAGHNHIASDGTLNRTSSPDPNESSSPYSSFCLSRGGCHSVAYHQKPH